VPVSPLDAPRWARGSAIAVLTAPGVLVAHLLTTGAAPAAVPALVVGVVVTLVACLLPAGGAGSTAAVAGLAQLAGHGVLALTVRGDAPGGGCLSVVGNGAETGVRFALAQRAGACPPGAVPAGPALTAVVAAVTAASVVLLGHAVLAALTGALVAAAATGLAVAGRLAAAVRPLLLLLAGAPRTGDVRRLPAPAPVPLTILWRPGPRLDRGPPAGCPAA
jgi:hypothetical protein